MAVVDAGAWPEQPDGLPAQEAEQSILLVDDHSIVRAGLRRLLEGFPGYRVIGESGQGREALALAARFRPDLALVDVNLPDTNGVELTRKLLSCVPGIKVIMLTMREDPELVREAITAGAVGYVAKRAAEAELLDALGAATRGDLYVHPSLTRALLVGSEPGTPVADVPNTVLTEREIDVLRLIARGLTSRQIADELVLSVRTVDTHRANMMEKLGFHRRTELVQYALKCGLLDNDPITAAGDGRESIV